jgi:ferric-dicitrate binding protein FerR (iron transport regulator)
MTALTRRLFFGLFILAGLVIASPQFAAEDTDVIGKVTRIQKAVYAMQDALPRKLDLDSSIQLGDVISTGKGARIEIVLNDGAEVTLGERTHLVMQEFIMENSENNAVMRLLEGAFKVTSGELVKLADSSMTVETNTATIGIRGTTFWGGSLDGDFEVALLGGKGVYVETKAGRVELSKVGDGTKILDNGAVPSEPTPWMQEKLNRAADTVTFE